MKSKAIKYRFIPDVNTKEVKLDEKVQKIADLLVDIVWKESDTKPKQK